jgi:hypothetical protein
MRNQQIECKQKQKRRTSFPKGNSFQHRALANLRRICSMNQLDRFHGEEKRGKGEWQKVRTEVKEKRKKRENGGAFCKVWYLFALKLSL